MSDTTGTQVASMRTGNHVAAIVPTTISEIWQVAKGVVASGLAPKSLGSGDDKVSAVAITIMAGMELGLKPMVALRSFTVINGKPALYGDGLINVVRGSGKVKKLQTGCDERDGKLVGWCHAIRLDTGEENRVEFSQDDAIQAGLWSPDKFIRKEVWGETRGQKVWKDDVPNDAPWHRFPKRMLAWRAAGYCLRELFGDVLGGIRDEFEEREIAEASFEEVPQASATRSQPPAPPPEEEDATDIDPFDPQAFVESVIKMVTDAQDEETLIAEWEAVGIDAALLEHGDLLDEVYEVRAKRLAVFDDVAEPDAGEEGEKE